jgi:UDP-2-acetamido-3-amino-2,3-dideoxy-glucuronate N-acetyltransferase
MRAPMVGRGASIGANATIVCGHDIGRIRLHWCGCSGHARVPAYALVVGNPARQTGWMSEFGHKLKFMRQRRGHLPGKRTTLSN